MGADGSLGVLRGSALYVGALIGPGVLLVPALAVQAAGAASIVAWAGLLVLSPRSLARSLRSACGTPSPAASPPTFGSGSETARRR